MNRRFIPVLLVIALLPVAVRAQVRVSGVGGGGLLQNLNDRMAKDVATWAPALGGGLQATYGGLFGAWDGAAFVGADLAVFPKTAVVGDLSLLVGAARRFSFLSQSWETTLCAGPALTLAPTRDAGSRWVSTLVQVDLRCETCPLAAGIYVRLQQIWMSDAKDPWMLGAGVTVRFDFLGTRPAAAKVSAPTPPPPAANPDDEDGDGVPAAADACPHSLPGARVQENGCEPISDGMQLDAGLFAGPAAALSPAGERECLRLAELLAVNRQLAVVLQVAAPAADLAQARAQALAERLRNLGVDAARILTEPRVQTSESVTLSFRLLLQ